MGQLFCIAGRRPDSVRNLFDQALRLYKELGGLIPTHDIRTGTVMAARFGTRQGAGDGGFQGSSGWMLGAGTWFYDRVTDFEALRRLADETETFRAINDQALKALDGSFTLICQSPDDTGFSVITDRIGTLHVYTRTLADCVLVSTSSMVLAALSAPEWDPLSCREFLAMGTVFEQRSLFKGIAKIPPATIWSCDASGNCSERRYWRMADHLYDRGSRQGSVAELAESLVDAVGVVSANFRRPLFDLTGGFDSRAVLGAGMRVRSELCTVVNGPSDSPDVIAAGRIASRFNLNHRHPSRTGAVDFWTNVKAAAVLCDGEYDALEYARILANHETLAGEFDISVNGSNGEICKGYWWELLWPHIGAKKPVDPRMLAAKRFAYDTWGADLLEYGAPADSIVDEFAAVIQRTNQHLSGYPNTAQIDNVYLTLRMQRWQGRIASATNRIWPCVSPFMFRAPMEIALSAPPRIRVRNRMSRRLIEFLNPQLAALPLAQGYPAIPLRLRTAHRFWPLAIEGAAAVGRRIFKAHAPSRAGRSTSVDALWAEEEACDLMRPERMSTRALYDSAKLRSFLSDAQSSTFSADRQLGRVLTLELLGQAVQGRVLYRETAIHA